MEYTYQSMLVVYCLVNYRIDIRVEMQAGAEGVHDTKYVTGPVVLNNNGRGMMWYRGSSNDSTPAIIYCEIP